MNKEKPSDLGKIEYFFRSHIYHIEKVAHSILVDYVKDPETAKNLIPIVAWIEYRLIIGWKLQEETNKVTEKIFTTPDSIASLRRYMSKLEFQKLRTVEKKLSNLRKRVDAYESILDPVESLVRDNIIR